MICNVLAGRRGLIIAEDNTAAKLRNASSADCALRFGNHIAGVNLAAFSPEGLLMLTTSDDTTAKLITEHSARRVRPPDAGHVGWLWCGVSPAPDEPLLRDSVDPSLNRFQPCFYLIDPQ